jgi:small-conductance mechanosensitive channel
LLGRVVLKVTTDIKSSPNAVIAILEQAAKEQPLVQTTPSPLAAVEAFTPSSIEYSLSVTLSDVNAGSRVKSNLHIAILDSLRSAGIYATLH